MRIKSEKLWYILIVITIFILFYFRGFVASSDAASSWFNPFYNIKNIPYLWSTYSPTGSFSPNDGSAFFLLLFYSIISMIKNNPSFIQKFSWISFFSFFGCICFYLINKDLNKGLNSYFAVLFLFFNPIAQYFMWGYQTWSYYLIVPYFIGIFLYVQFSIKENPLLPIGISFLWFIFGFVFNQPAYFGSFAIIIFFLFLFNLLIKKEKISWILKNFRFLMIFILINLVYLLPLMLGGVSILNETQEMYGGGDPMPILKDLKNLNFFYSFSNLSKGYGDFYLQNVLFIGTWTIFLMILFSYLLYAKKPNKSDTYFIFIVLFLIFIFLIKGISKPFSQLSSYLYSFKLLYIFRNFKDKFAIGYSILASFLFIILLKKDKRILKVFLITLSIISVFLFISNIWLGNEFSYSENLDYFKEINLNNKEVRVLNLPLVDYSFFYTSDPRFTGNNPLKNLLQKDVIYTTDIKTQKHTLKLKNKFLNRTLSDKELYDYLKIHNVAYIINNKNSYVKEDSDPYLYDEDIISGYLFLNRILENERFGLYEFKEPLSRISSRNLFFKKINPTKYKVYIEDLNSIQNISFLESYHRYWKLYLVKNPSNDWCNPIEFYNNTNTTECEHTQKFFEGEELSYLWKEPIFDDTHHLVYDYANGWTIDPQYIKDNCPSEYYKLNEDGSIDIELVMYFKPQSYFRIGLIISGTTLICCIAYLIYDFGKHSKNKNKFKNKETIENELPRPKGRGICK